MQNDRHLDNNGRRLGEHAGPSRMQRPSLGDAFVRRISARALVSKATHHPYLRALRIGAFPDIHLALQDFAFQYSRYSRHFVTYLSAVIDNLSDPEHKRILQSNLADERGEAHDVDLPPDVQQSIAGLSHANLFQRFQDALGANAAPGPEAADSRCGEAWRDAFQALCERNEYVGVGAIGIGTELIVSRIYAQILKGLKRHSRLTASERVFFDLHSHCDDEHAEQLMGVAVKLAQDRKACEQIGYGVLMAIDLRRRFWDTMLERARRFPAAATNSVEALPDVGYQAGL